MRVNFAYFPEASKSFCVFKSRRRKCSPELFLYKNTNTHTKSPDRFRLSVENHSDVLWGKSHSSIEISLRLTVNRYKQTPEKINACVARSGLIKRKSYRVLRLLNMKISTNLIWAKHWLTSSLMDLNNLMLMFPKIKAFLLSSVPPARSQSGRADRLPPRLPILSGRVVMEREKRKHRVKLRRKLSPAQPNTPNPDTKSQSQVQRYLGT